MRKPRVSYKMVSTALGTDPKLYVRELREETGLAWWKIARDLGKDAGVEVCGATVRNWGMG